MRHSTQSVNRDALFFRVSTTEGDAWARGRVIDEYFAWTAPVPRTVKAGDRITGQPEIITHRKTGLGVAVHVRAHSFETAYTIAQLLRALQVDWSAELTTIAAQFAACDIEGFYNLARRIA